MENKKAAMGTMKILILHGWSYSTERWLPFVQLMKNKGLHPKLLEIPGLTTPIDKPWTLDDYVEWLRKKIGKTSPGDRGRLAPGLAGRPREKVILIGHSNGGRLALAFGLKYPANLKQLILIDSAGIRHGGGLMELKRFLFRGLAKVGRKVTTATRARNVLYKLARANDYKDATPQMRETMVNLISTDLAPQLNKVSVPTLIIWGAEDKTTPLSQGKLMHRLIPNSRFYVVKGARHSPQFTHPEEVCKKIVEAVKQ